MVVVGNPGKFFDFLGIGVEINAQFGAGIRDGFSRLQFVVDKITDNTVAHGCRPHGRGGSGSHDSRLCCRRGLLDLFFGSIGTGRVLRGVKGRQIQHLIHLDIVVASDAVHFADPRLICKKVDLQAFTDPKGCVSAFHRVCDIITIRTGHYPKAAKQHDRRKKAQQNSLRILHIHTLRDCKNVKLLSIGYNSITLWNKLQQLFSKLRNYFSGPPQEGFLFARNSLFQDLTYIIALRNLRRYIRILKILLPAGNRKTGGVFSPPASGVPKPLIQW